VAHPDLVPTVREVFDAALGGRPNQKDRRREDVSRNRDRLLDARIPGGQVTEAGVRGNVSVALQYLEAWLRGSGAVAINNMMEDTATAEIARAQLWQWIRHGSRTERGAPVTLARVRAMLAEELAQLRAAAPTGNRLEEAAQLLDALVAAEEFPEFLTLEAYGKLA
jgi:malate synthase